mmetsp:Transcript_33060/g.32437  ORF Transcript_33060/g.32437 Transcript_33060/m.32437 type:complete len:216 (-) Transcript_33060:36-683(-)
MHNSKPNSSSRWIYYGRTVPKLAMCLSIPNQNPNKVVIIKYWKNPEDEDTAIKSSPKQGTSSLSYPGLLKKRFSSHSLASETAFEPFVPSTKLAFSKSKSLLVNTQKEASADLRTSEPKDLGEKKREKKASKKSICNSKQTSDSAASVKPRKRTRARRGGYQKMVDFAIKLPKCAATREELKAYKRRKYQEERANPEPIFHPKKGYAVRSKNPAI